MLGRGGALVDDERGDGKPGELEGEGEPDGTGPDDEHLGVQVGDLGCVG
jgi:hypothetical protein